MEILRRSCNYCVDYYIVVVVIINVYTLSSEIGAQGISNYTLSSDLGAQGIPSLQRTDVDL